MVVEDTYAEAFGGVYARLLVTAKDERWLMNAVNCVTGYSTSTLGCDCEAGIESLTNRTPDNRVGAILQFHVPSWRKEAVRDLEMALIHRISQCVLTCPTTRVFNASDSAEKLGVGKKMGFFGDGFQENVERYGRKMVLIPIMAGEFLIEEEFGYGEGVMGGNIWIMGDSEDNALNASLKAVDAVHKIGGVITSFPGGICSSGSKVGSKYKFMVASTQHEYCPTLKGKTESKLPNGVSSATEIVINGISEEKVTEAMRNAVKAIESSRGVIKVTAANFGGRLGKHKIRLRA